MSALIREINTNGPPTTYVNFGDKSIAMND